MGSPLSILTEVEDAQTRKCYCAGAKKDRDMMTGAHSTCGWDIRGKYRETDGPIRIQDRGRDVMTSSGC
ncbi:hypothetical protein FKM82_016036 [Ascaphus truei]